MCLNFSVVEFCLECCVFSCEECFCFVVWEGESSSFWKCSI